MSHTIYLLGGQDLEMVEIRQILTVSGCHFEDRKLEWGAKLSDYQDLLNDEDLFIGIELTLDIALPCKYEVIDHHNENSGKPSSIVQLAKKLGIELDRRQQLIAANDSGYIPGMLALGASKEEVDEIRKLDREAQGATELDEQLAEESLLYHLSIIGKVTVVNALTSKFSTIVDRLYPFSRLLVYTSRELTYYGTGAIDLQQLFPELVWGNKVYFGGGSNGFFGFKPENFDFAEINHLKDNLLQFINHN